MTRLPVIRTCGECMHAESLPQLGEYPCIACHFHIPGEDGDLGACPIMPASDSCEHFNAPTGITWEVVPNALGWYLHRGIKCLGFVLPSGEGFLSSGENLQIYNDICDAARALVVRVLENERK